MRFVYFDFVGVYLLRNNFEKPEIEYINYYPYAFNFLLLRCSRTYNYDSRSFFLLRSVRFSNKNNTQSGLKRDFGKQTGDHETRSWRFFAFRGLINISTPSIIVICTLTVRQLTVSSQSFIFKFFSAAFFSRIIEIDFQRF